MPALLVMLFTVLTLLTGCADGEIPSTSSATRTTSAQASPSAPAQRAPNTTPTASVTTAGTPTAVGTAASVLDVVDGDTIEVGIGGATSRVRFILVDTPEVFGGVQCYGREASNFTKSLLPAGTPVRLERDVSETDRFGRLLRYVYLSDGRMVNEILLSEGFARVATFPPDVRYVDRLLVAQREAQARAKGLWSACQSGATPAPSAPAATVTTGAEPYYANCAAARAAGAAPIRRGQPGYRSALDGDNDGVACE